MKEDHIFRHNYEFELEAGEALPGFQLKYTTLGQLNKDRSNAVWVIHALTGNSDGCGRNVPSEVYDNYRTG